MKLDFCRKPVGALDIIIASLCMSDNDSITELDMSYCNLFDQDLEKVLAIVKLLPNCKIVNLTGSSLGTRVKSTILQFTALPSLEYLLIAGTNLCKDLALFEGLTSVDIAKIIFLTPSTMFDRAYYSLAYHSLVITTHLKFFNITQRATRLQTRNAEIAYVKSQKKRVRFADEK
jgi:hypothetical protein